MEASSDGEGEVDRVRLSGHAVVGQAEGSLGADLIDADRRHDGAEAGWMVSASGAVIVSTAGRRGRGLLRADTATAEFDDLGHLRKGEARGGVRYEGEGIAASAARGTFEAADAREIVSLYSDLAVKARLARERTRVAADKIVSNPTGSYLDAEGRVEASLLPASAGGGAPSAQALFDGGTVVHFVSERLHATASDGRLHFTGTVRGWQGERNLSADEVTIDQDPETLQAQGHVVSRVPRESGPAVSEADFVRIAADQLEYSGARRKAVYSGSARVRQSEGWVEADTVTVSFAAERGDIEEVESLGKVRFEFHGKDRDGLPVSVTGSADRAVYEPKAQDFWLYGVQAPAQVTRPGTQGGTTTGRVLRYRLDDGTLSVESGGRGRARIRTP
jgi:lipopolysaccharide transport protein LptA